MKQKAKRSWKILKILIILKIGVIGVQTIYADIPDSTASIDDSDYFFLKSLCALGECPDSSYDDEEQALPPKPPPPPEKIELKNEDDWQTLSDEELYRLFFNKEIVRSRDFMVRLFVDEKDFGIVQVLYDSAFTYYDFYSKEFSNYLDTLFSAEGREKTNGLDGHFNSLRMDSLNFAVDLDHNNYELRIYTPPELRALLRTLLNKREHSRGELTQPAFFSFYLNMEGDQQIRCLEYFSKNDEELPAFMKQIDGCARESAILDLDGAAAMLGWVLEGYGVIREPRQGQNFNKSNIRRGDFRLVRDMYSSKARLSLGDVSSVSEGLMRYETMGGARYEHNERLFGGNPASERYTIRFLLPRPAQVEIQTDGRVMRRLSLPAGSHEISGFSGQRGLNSIQVFITQDDGTFRAIPYEFELGDSRNLHKGESRYSISAGMHRSSNVSSYDYHIKEPGINASYLYGFNPFLSAGTIGQASPQNIMAGAQILLSADNFSWWVMRALANYADSSEFGHGAELEYTRETKLTRLTLNGQYRSKSFNPHLFGKSPNSSPEIWNATSRFTLNLPKGNFSILAGASLNRRIPETTHSLLNYRYGVDISQRFSGINFRASTEAVVREGAFEPYISFSANYAFGMEKHQFSFMDEIAHRPVYVPPTFEIGDIRAVPGIDPEIDIKETPGYTKNEWQNTANFTWDWTNAMTGEGARRYSAGIGMQDNFSSRFSADHSYNRTQISAHYNVMGFDTDYSTSRNHFIYATGGASFMFADGLWAFGRPVYNGFMLADTKNGLKGSTVYVNYSEFFNNYYSKNGWLGAAYYNQIMNYRPNEIQVSLTDIPIGAWLEQDRYYAMGAYKQGYAIKLGSEARAILQVRLTDEAGPFAYKYVTVEQLDSKGNTTDKRATFTNRDGLLQSGNIKPGSKYRLIFSTDSYVKDIDLIIPTNAGSLIILPDIQVEHEAQ